MSGARALAPQFFDFLKSWSAALKAGAARSHDPGRGWARCHLEASRHGSETLGDNLNRRDDARDSIFRPLMFPDSNHGPAGAR